MTPHLGGHFFFYYFHPLLGLRPIERLFELTGRPSRALNLALYVAFKTAKIQGHTVRTLNCVVVK